MKTIRRMILFTMVTLISLPVAALAASDGSSFKCDSVNIAYQIIPNGAMIVKHKEWLKPAMPGVNIKWIEFHNGAAVARAMASGDVDIGLAGSVGVAGGISAGVDNIVPWIFDVEGENEALVVRKDAGIDSVADLAGKTLGTPTGATTQYSLLSLLKLKGLSDKVTVLNLQNPEAIAAWTNKEIDGDYTWQPTVGKLIEMNGKVLVNSGEMAKKYGVVTADLAFVRRAYADKCPKVVTAWVGQQSRAVDYYRKNPDDSVKAVAAELGISPEDTASEMKQLVWLDGQEQLKPKWLGTTSHPGALVDTLEKTAQFLKDQQLVQKAAPKSEFRDAVVPKFLEDALQSK